MKTIRHTTLVLALAAALPAMAQSNADILKELQALKAQVAELEAKLKAQEAAKPQWGMTPDQARELNRITVKTEALEDSRDSAGLKLLKISGYADPTWIYNKAQKRAGFQFLNRVSDDGYNYDNSYFGAVSLDFQKETDSGTRWRLTLVPNRGTDSVIGNGGVVHEASPGISPTGPVTNTCLPPRTSSSPTTCCSTSRCPPPTPVRAWNSRAASGSRRLCWPT
jgi:Protein of unknown function (DUF3138)